MILLFRWPYLAFCFYTESYLLQYTGIIYLALPTLNEWINKIEKNEIEKNFRLI